MNECSVIGCMNPIFAKELCKQHYAHDYDRRRYEEQGEHLRAVVREYNKKNKKLIKERRAKYYEENAERIKARVKAWRKAHPILVADMKAASRYREQYAEGKHDYKELKILREKQRGCCAICKKNFGKKYHKDHIIPLAAGGTNWIHNIQYLCAKCNLRKNKTDPVEFMMSQGYLL